VTGTRQRRSSTEVREQLLATAEKLFSERGYGATTTRDIAAAAGIAESALFRHFGSKANLMSEAVVAPFATFLEEFTATWQRAEPAAGAPRAADSDPQLFTSFITELYRNLTLRRPSILALLSAVQAPDAGEVVASVADQLDEMFDKLRRIGEQHAASVGEERADSELNARIVVGMVTSMAVLDGWFLPRGADRPDSHRLITAMADLVSYGRTGPPR
jgi:AcrR family transcriptional regulator